MKKILAILMTLAMLLTLVPAAVLADDSAESTTAPAAEDTAAAENVCGENITWALTDGTLTISGTGAMNDFASPAAAPWFESRYDILSVQIDTGVTKIGSNAFVGEWNLTDVSIPGTVTAIGDNAFWNCTALRSAAYNSIESAWSVISIGEGNAELTSAAISYAYNGTDVLTGDCGEELTWVLSGGTLTISGTGAMWDYTEEKNAPWADASCRGSIKAIVLEEGVTSVGDYAFRYCNQAKSAALPETVTSIGENAFLWCTSLKTLTLPAAVQKIGEGAFHGCSRLTDVEIPSGVKTIEASAFMSCSRLKTLKLPVSVKSIGKKAFFGCSKLATVNYTGTEAQWKAITVSENNDPLTAAAVNLECDTDKTVKSFDDVQDPDAYYYTAVLWAAENGIASGVSSTTFAPMQNCTRAQVITFLYRAAGSPAVYGVKNPFTDVEEGSWYYTAVLWGYQKGIVSGMTETTFEPATLVTRAQFVTFLYRYAGKPEVNGLTPFNDVDQTAWYYNAVRWGYKNNYVEGIDSFHFDPDGKATRAQAVTLIWRYQGRDSGK